MEHSIFLDSEKINSIRESLDEKFNRIEVIDDSVTPKIIQWLDDFFSYIEDFNSGLFIANKNVDLERWAYNFSESNPYIFIYSPKEILNEIEYEKFSLYVSYCKIKGELQKENKVLMEEIMNDFYLVKLPLLEPILSSVIKGISIKLNNSNNHKKHFEDLKTHIEEFYFKSMSDNSAEKETQESIPKKLDCYPFQNLEILNFFLHIEKTTSKRTKIFYSYLLEFLIAKRLFSDSNLNRQNYYDWINKVNCLTGQDKIKYQHNLSSEHDYFKAFESEFKHYEKTIKSIPRIE
jgi:uncharacterized protein YnzC (UPF0291/DUF896 family)